MPIGVIVNALSVISGGLIGGFLSKRKSFRSTDSIILILGVCAAAMGINAIVKMESLPAVVLSVIVGTIIGESIKLDRLIVGFLKKVLSKFISKNVEQKDYRDKLLVITVLACASGTGIYGALLSGMTGDHSILITKSILDLFTSLIFALSLSYVVAFLGVFQFVILGAMFLSATFIIPFTNEVMIADFIACGGIIMLATGLKIANIRDINIANMIPSLVLVMPFSYLASLVF